MRFTCWHMFLLSTFCLLSCKTLQSEDSNVAFIESDASVVYSGIYGTIQVCLIGTSSNVHKSRISEAIEAWVEAVADLDSDIIFPPNIKFACGRLSPSSVLQKEDFAHIRNYQYSLDADYTVIYHPEISRAFAKIPERGQPAVVFLAPNNDSYGIILHEFGHAMVGLKDTYVDDGSGQCRAGQPRSVMCNHYNFGTNIMGGSRDDYHGARAMFKKAPPPKVSRRDYRQQITDELNDMKSSGWIFPDETYVLQWCMLKRNSDCPLVPPYYERHGRLTKIEGKGKKRYTLTDGNGELVSQWSEHYDFSHLLNKDLEVRIFRPAPGEAKLAAYRLKPLEP